MSRIAPNIETLRQKIEPVFHEHHLDHVRAQRCLVSNCRRLGCEAHHLRDVPYTFKTRGMGSKNDDIWAVPLCEFHHQHGGPDCVHYVGTKQEVRWFVSECDVDDIQLLALTFALTSPVRMVAETAYDRLRHLTQIEGGRDALSFN